MNTLKIALVAAVVVALPVIGCAAADVPEETNVSTEQNVDPTARTGAIIGSSGTIVQVDPTYNPPVPPVACPTVCTRTEDGKACYCPHGFGVKSGAVCPYGKQFLCFAAYCACY